MRLKYCQQLQQLPFSLLKYAIFLPLLLQLVLQLGMVDLLLHAFQLVVVEVEVMDHAKVVVVVKAINGTK